MVRRQRQRAGELAKPRVPDGTVVDTKTGHMWIGPSTARPFERSPTSSAAPPGIPASEIDQALDVDDATRAAVQRLGDAGRPESPDTPLGPRERHTLDFLAAKAGITRRNLDAANPHVGSRHVCMRQPRQRLPRHRPALRRQSLPSRGRPGHKTPAGPTCGPTRPAERQRVQAILFRRFRAAGEDYWGISEIPER